MSKASELVNEFETLIRNRVNDLGPADQASFGFGYVLGALQGLAESNPAVFEALQDRVDFMKGA